MSDAFRFKLRAIVVYRTPNLLYSLTTLLSASLLDTLHKSLSYLSFPNDCRAKHCIVLPKPPTFRPPLPPRNSRPKVLAGDFSRPT